MKSMTGFGSKEMLILPFGKICLEIRSTNHKFLETVFHLPAGFLSLEDKLKQEIEARVKRGRVVCAMNITGGSANNIFVNKRLLKNYISTLRKIQRDSRLKDEVRLDTLIHLPGVLSLAENQISKTRIWPRLKVLVQKALDELVRMRRKEGQALGRYLKIRAQALEAYLNNIKRRLGRVIRDKATRFKTEEERSSFLKDADISEEMERLIFHAHNFHEQLLKDGPIGKELDFIAQEMQREANTMGAKSCDAMVSSQVVQVKSQIEKMREQLQNIE
ncbi:MAG: YicC family protein [Candidatus Omnitrophica bacterium]|nr:YicC family protein [Candidatus Omnitrophota bacterium]MDD5592478.1 YicC family protein [Candidatus Omnitrophota bacterium]